MKKTLFLIAALSSTAAIAEPSFTVEDGKCLEGQPCPVTVKKHGTLNNEPSTIIAYTIDGTAKEPVDYRAAGVVLTFSATETLKAMMVPSLTREGTQGTRRFGTKLVALENARLYDGTGFMDINEPPPVPVKAKILVNAGSSIPSPSYSFSREWAADNGVPVVNLAITGGGISTLNKNLAAANAANAMVESINVCTNDLTSYATAQAYWDALLTYTDARRATGSKVIVTSCLPKGDQPLFNARAHTFTALGDGYVLVKRIDGYVNWDKLIPEVANDTFPLAFSDKIHPGPLSHDRLKVGFDAVAGPMFGLTPPVIGPPVIEPTPVPTPTPEPTPPVVPTAGEVPIQSNFDINTFLSPRPSASPAPTNEVVGAFRFICNPAQLLYDDPIVYPGQPGRSHLHQFYGNTGANANSTYQSLRTSGDSTCMSPLNRSAYWMPAMLDGLGNVVRPDFVAIYYKRRPASDPKCQQLGGTIQGEGICTDLPDGLKFIFGYDMLTGKAPTGSMEIRCFGKDASGKLADNSLSHSLAEAKSKCVVGGQVAIILHAPGCWNNKDLDSPNHRDHVAYTYLVTVNGLTYNRCPDTHPARIPAFQLKAHYLIVAGDDISKWSASSDAMVPNAPNGSTFHADFDMAWDPLIKNRWHANCLNKKLSCNDGDNGDGSGQTQFAGFTYKATPRLVPMPTNPMIH